MRWVKTAPKVYGLEDEPRHFVGFVKGIADGKYIWYLPGGYSSSCTWKPGTTWVDCGEEPTETSAKRALKKALEIKEAIK